MPFRVKRYPSMSTLRFVESLGATHGNQELYQTIAQAAGVTQPSLWMDSQAEYGAVAQVDAALYLWLPSDEQRDYREKIWGHAAGPLIVEEGGGGTTDMFCENLDFASDYQMRSNCGVVVRNTALNTLVLKALADDRERAEWTQTARYHKTNRVHTNS